MNELKALIPAWENGVLKPVEKLEVHKRGLRHKAISVFVMCDGKLLIQRRATGKYHTPGLWANTCCTHPHWQEDAPTCAARRLTEELGFTVPLEHRDQIEYRADVFMGLIEHEVVDIFIADLDDMPTVAPNPEEVMEVAWVTLDELNAQVTAHPERFTPWVKIYLDMHSEQIFGNRIPA